VKSLTAPNFPHHRIATNRGQRRKSENVEIVTLPLFFRAATFDSDGAEFPPTPLYNCCGRTSGGFLDWLTDVRNSGYGLIPNVFAPAEIESLLNALQDEALPRTRAGVRHAMRSSNVTKIANDLRMSEIARKILGPNAIPFRATLFEKLPESNWLVAWHQDTALPLQERREAAGWGPWSIKDGVNYAHAPAKALEKVVALRLHVDDSNLDNGPLRVLPATHTQGVLTDEEILSIAARTHSVDCLVPKGGIVAMRPLIIHASSKSQTDNPRRVLHIEYAESTNIDANVNLAIN
jgi:Phytanoyl-CoA dioxygenase (PhyH)